MTTETTNGEIALLGVLADIRQKSGLGDKPMLSDLSDSIGKRINAAQSLRKALSDFRFHAGNNKIAKIENSKVITMPKCEGGGKAIYAECFERLATAMYEYDEATK